jgi:translation initiation factor 4G
MYAELCVKLQNQLSEDVRDELLLDKDGKPIAGGLLFRKYLLGRCQEDFEKGWKKREDASVAAKSKEADDAQKKAEHEKAIAGGQQVEEFKFSDEYYAEQTAKRQGLGLVKFVGELFKLGLLSTKIILACIKQLLMNVVDPDEEDVESLCQLMSTAGQGLDQHSEPCYNTMTVFMQRMEELSRSPHISSRIKFMVVVSGGDECSAGGRS